MSAYDHLPPLKAPRSMSWYETIPREEDEALEEGLRLLELLRSALPPDRESAVDEAGKLLREAAALYNRARNVTSQLHEKPETLDTLLPPSRKKMLEQLCALLSQGTR